MPHPTETIRIGGVIFHLEDDKLKRADAMALKRHLKRTEDKNVRVFRQREGYEVWWAKRH